ncbi:MAG: HEAT repeat domain-containing protein [Deltaproteobacteria bacterium]|nr:HEAT repeat domain-containing protein [Deltaproteobacteria bacterium]
MSDNSDSQRCDNDSAIFEVIKNKHHNELASLLVKILGSNTSVLIANNARWIVVNELELALKDTQDLKLKNRFKEILKNLVFTEQGDNNREHFAFLLSSKVECFSLNDNEKYDLWSKFLQVEKQSHFTSNDRLAAIIELTTITDAKLLSKVALLFWDVLFDNYNGKDNNEDVFHERTVLLTDLYELYGNAKIFNSSNVPYPTSPKAIFTLNHIFEDKNFNYSYVLAAVNIAFKIGADTTPAIPKLSEALKDEDEKVRESATKALVEIEGPVAIAVLIEALKDENYNVRGAAASILGSIQDPAAISALSGALKDSTWEVRYTAVKALGEIKDSAAVPVLTKALRDTNIDVRLAVAEALAKIEKAHPNSTTSKQKDSSNPETLQAGSAETTQEK